jgi:hypothetical protein
VSRTCQCLSWYFIGKSSFMITNNSISYSYAKIVFSGTLVTFKHYVRNKYRFCTQYKKLAPLVLYRKCHYYGKLVKSIIKFDALILLKSAQNNIKQPPQKFCIYIYIYIPYLRKNWDNPAQFQISEVHVTTPDITAALFLQNLSF